MREHHHHSHDHEHEHGAHGPALPGRRDALRAGTGVVIASLLALSLLASACGRQTGGAESGTTSVQSSAAPSVGAVSGETAHASLTISRAGSRSVQRGPAEQFTGTARIEPLFAATDSSRAAGASVSFAPGARTAWHTHPRGQVLIVTAGSGRVQRRGGPVEEIRAGDVVWTPPGVEHWHGAAPTTAVTHIAIQEHLDGQVVTWGRKVTATEYRPIGNAR